MWDCEKIDVLLSGYLDGELTHGDRQRVELHVEACPKCHKTYEEMCDLRNAVGKMNFGTIPEEKWREVMNDMPARATAGLGWFLYIAGTVILLAYGGYEFAVDDAVPALIKVCVAALIVGPFLLFIAVLRQRMIAYRSDRYKDVEI